MTTQKQTTTGRLTVIVSDDRLKAWLCQPQQATPGYVYPTRDELLEAVNAADLETSDELMSRVDTLAEMCSAAQQAGAAPPEIPEKYLVAEGVPAVNAVDGALELDEEFRQGDEQHDESDSVDYFTMNSIQTIEEGTIIGVLRPPVEGEAGKDVYGSDIPPKQKTGQAFKLAFGLKLADDGEHVVTEVPGRIVLEPGKARIDDVLQINSDVNFDTGSLDVCVDVSIHGTIQSNFNVRTTKNLLVDKAVEAARVDVGGDAVVRGGVCGHECQGHIRVGGTLSARFCNEARVEVDGDFNFEKELLNSRVRSRSRLVSERGTIIGGEAWAREAMEVHVLGSEAGVVTRVAVGIPPDVLARARQMDRSIKEQRKTADKIREKVQPLIANLKRLTSQQREAATELMSKADEIEMQVETLEKNRDEMMTHAQPEGEPFVLVHGMIHPGVRISIGEDATKFERLVHGPVKIGLRKVNNITEVVAVNQRSGSVTVLPSHELDLDQILADALAEEEEQDGTDEHGNVDE